MTDTLRAPSSGRPLSAAGPRLPPFSSPVRIDVSALTHPGHVRPNNEDQFFVTRLTRSLETMLTSLPAGEVPAACRRSQLPDGRRRRHGRPRRRRSGQPDGHQRAGQAGPGGARLVLQGGRGTRPRNRAARPSCRATGRGGAGRARASGRRLARHGIDDDRRSKPWPRPSDCPRRRLARLPVPCRTVCIV